MSLHKFLPPCLALLLPMLLVIFVRLVVSLSPCIYTDYQKLFFLLQLFPLSLFCLILSLFFVFPSHVSSLFVKLFGILYILQSFSSLWTFPMYPFPLLFHTYNNSIFPFSPFLLTNVILLLPLSCTSPSCSPFSSLCFLVHSFCYRFHYFSSFYWYQHGTDKKRP